MDNLLRSWKIKDEKQKLSNIINIIEAISDAPMLKENGVRYKDYVFQDLIQPAIKGNNAIYQVNLNIGNYDIDLYYNFAAKENNNFRMILKDTDEKIWIKKETNWGNIFTSNKDSDEFMLHKLKYLNETFGSLGPLSHESFKEWKKYNNEIYGAVRSLLKESGIKQVPYLINQKDVNDLMMEGKVKELEIKLNELYNKFQEENYLQSELNHARYEMKNIIKEAHNIGVQRNPKKAFEDKLYNDTSRGFFDLDYEWFIIPASEKEKLQRGKKADNGKIIVCTSLCDHYVISDLIKAGNKGSLFVNAQTFSTVSQMLKTGQVDTVIADFQGDRFNIDEEIKLYKSIGKRLDVIDTTGKYYYRSLVDVNIKLVERGLPQIKDYLPKIIYNNIMNG